MIDLTPHQALVLACVGAVISVICILLAGCLALADQRKKPNAFVRRELHDILKTLEK